MLPGAFLALDPYERAFVMAAIDVRVAQEERERRKMGKNRP